MRATRVVHHDCVACGHHQRCRMVISTTSDVEVVPGCENCGSPVMGRRSSFLAMTLWEGAPLRAAIDRATYTREILDEATDAAFRGDVLKPQVGQMHDTPSGRIWAREPTPYNPRDVNGVDLNIKVTAPNLETAMEQFTAELLARMQAESFMVSQQRRAITDVSTN